MAFLGKKTYNKKSLDGKTDMVFVTKSFPLIEVYKFCGYKYKFPDFLSLAIIAFQKAVNFRTY